MQTSNKELIGALAEQITNCMYCSLDGYVCKIHTQITTKTILENTQNIMNELKSYTKIYGKCV